MHLKERTEKSNSVLQKVTCTVLIVQLVYTVWFRAENTLGSTLNLHIALSNNVVLGLKKQRECQNQPLPASNRLLLFQKPFQRCLLNHFTKYRYKQQTKTRTYTSVTHTKRYQQLVQKQQWWPLCCYLISANPQALIFLCNNLLSVYFLIP